MGWTYSTQTEKDEALKSIEQSSKELKSAQEKGENLPGVEELFWGASNCIVYGQDFLFAWISETGKTLDQEGSLFPGGREGCDKRDNRTPLAGADLGGGVRRVRMSIKSKGKGKSGGARVIIFNYLLDDDNRDITLMTIYDKSERETISDKEIIELRNAILGIE